MKIEWKCGVAGAMLLFIVYPAAAELGGDQASVEADRVHMKAASRALQAQKYTVQEIQDTNGTLIREYLSPAGKVFAVAWNGPQMPDLQQLFGATYFKSYQETARVWPGGRGPRRVESTELVVHSGGHMRAFSGMAYVPKLMPADVAIGDLE